MSATIQPPAAPAPRAEAEPCLAPAEGLELLGALDGAGQRGGASLVRREDGQVLQLGTLQYGLLECLDGTRTTAELAEALTERLGRRVGPEHVVALAEKLAACGLLAGTEHNAPARQNPLLALRWKVLVTNPAITRRLTAPFTVLFRPWVMWPVLVAFAATLWFVLVEQGIASATSQAFGNPELLLLVFALGLVSAGFHELGHAAAARYGGATPGGMGVGLYMVWPAFYTDVTDSYRLPRRDRLRVDLGGLHFNAIVAVVTMAVWLVLRVDALLLLVGLQVLQMVKQLSPVIRADGYHVLADLTGVPDLYAHLGPTLRRLVPWRRREPSSLTGRARAIVTVWVLVSVPLLLALAAGAILMLPRLFATVWASGSDLAAGLPDQVSDGQLVDAAVAVLRLIALALPLLGGVLFAQSLLRSIARSALRWADGRTPRRAFVAVMTAVCLTFAGWALWPAGQYEPVHASDRGSLVDLGRAVAEPRSAVRPLSQPAAYRLKAGRHLAVAMVPRGGASKRYPAIFVVRGKDGDPSVAILSETAPAIDREAVAAAAGTGTTEAAGATAPASGATAPPAGSAPADVAPAKAASAGQAVSFPFELPEAPGPGDTQALAVNKKDGGVTYDIAYSVVTVEDGAPVTSKNSAFALASCKACTTVAVSFQVVLVVGQSNVIAPINAAGALNVDCPACVTTAIAYQLVVSLESAPSADLLERLNARLASLDDLSSLGADATGEDLLREVMEVRDQVRAELDRSGIVFEDAEQDEPASSQPTSTTPSQTTTGETTPAPAPSGETTATEPAPSGETTTTEPPPSGETTSSEPPPSGETTTTSTTPAPAPAETTETEPPPPTTTTSTTPEEEPPPPTTSTTPPE